jgi:hypothetical protein
VWRFIPLVPPLKLGLKASCSHLGADTLKAFADVGSLVNKEHHVSLAKRKLGGLSLKGFRGLKALFHQGADSSNFSVLGNKVLVAQLVWLYRTVDSGHSSLILIGSYLGLLARNHCFASCKVESLLP